MKSTLKSVLLFGLLCLPGHAQVRIVLKSDRVSVEINHQPFTDLYMGQEARKPFLFPLRTASGKKVSRGFPIEPAPGDPTDHPHQKGLWMGVERMYVEGLGEMDLWENDRSYINRPNLGAVVFKDVTSENSGATEGGFTFLADWMSPQGTAVVTETRTMTFYAEPKDCRMFDVDVHLRALRDLTFEDHQDNVIGIRLGPAFDEKNGGRPINAQHQEGSANTRGQQSEWLDWETVLDGEAVGVTLMDYPSNYGSPTHWHVRPIGLMAASPFGQHYYSREAPSFAKSLRSGEEMHFRYRILIHPKATGINAIYKDFASK